MKKYILLVLIWLTLSSCNMLKKEVIKPIVELTPEQIEQIEKDKFEKLLEEEDKKNLKFIEQQIENDRKNIEALYKRERFKMSDTEIKEEARLLNLKKMTIIPVQ